VLVVTADQKGSRHGPDLVDEVLDLIGADGPGGRWTRRPERTAGDEVQGVTDDPAHAVEVALALVRDGRWSVGIGAGAVRRPLPRSARAGAGPAYEHARRAVERAKAAPERVAVGADDDDAAEAAEAVLALLATVVQRRSRAGWEAVDLMVAGLTRAEAADRLGISKQALSQRLRAGAWPQEERARRVAAALLSAADGSMDP
jgi:hypothetical protein